MGQSRKDLKGNRPGTEITGQPTHENKKKEKENEQRKDRSFLPCARDRAYR